MLLILIAFDIGERVWSKFTASINFMLGEIDLALTPDSSLVLRLICLS